MGTKRTGYLIKVYQELKMVIFGCVSGAMVNFLLPLIWDSQTFGVTLRAHTQEYCFYAREEKDETRCRTSCDVS